MEIHIYKLNKHVQWDFAHCFLIIFQLSESHLYEKVDWLNLDSS